MSTGALITTLVAVLVVVGARALYIRAVRERQQARRSQVHSGVKPAPMADEAKLVATRRPEEMG